MFKADGDERLFVLPTRGIDYWCSSAKPLLWMNLAASHMLVPALPRTCAISNLVEVKCISGSAGWLAARHLHLKGSGAHGPKLEIDRHFRWPCRHLEVEAATCKNLPGRQSQLQGV